MYPLMTNLTLQVRLFAAFSKFRLSELFIFVFSSAWCGVVHVLRTSFCFLDVVSLTAAFISLLRQVKSFYGVLKFKFTKHSLQQVNERTFSLNTDNERQWWLTEFLSGKWKFSTFCLKRLTKFIIINKV